MRLTATLAILSTLACAMAPLAAEGRDHEGSGRCGEGRAKLVERFDANHDGKLDEGERATAKAALQEHRGEIAGKVLAKHPELDADGDGTLSREEAKAGREGLRAKRQAEFKDKHPKAFAKVDGNGDGVIDASERAAVKAAYLAKHPGADADGDGKLSRCERKDARKDAHGDNGRRAHGDPAGDSHDHGRRGATGN